MTTMADLFFRSGTEAPFQLTPPWVKAKSTLDPLTAMNVSTTNDIIGGNSGSPVLNRDGAIVGLAFDGNIHSTGGAFGFDPALNRTVSVSSQVLLEALRKIYGAAALADELERKS
jgi:hypothetical protein